jgi:hypothetical protein
MSHSTFLGGGGGGHAGNGPIKIRRSSRHVESLSTCRNDRHLLLSCQLFLESSKKKYEFNVGPETGQKLHSVFLHTSIVV